MKDPETLKEHFPNGKYLIEIELVNVDGQKASIGKLMSLLISQDDLFPGIKINQIYFRGRDAKLVAAEKAKEFIDQLKIELSENLLGIDLCKIETEVPNESVKPAETGHPPLDPDHYEYDSYTTGRKQDYGHHTLNTENGWDCYSWHRDDYTETMDMKRPKGDKGWKPFRVITYISCFEDFLSEVLAKAYYETLPNIGYRSLVEVDPWTGEQVRVLEHDI